MIVPDLFGRFGGYLSPSMLLGTESICIWLEAVARLVFATPIPPLCILLRVSALFSKGPRKAWEGHLPCLTQFVACCWGTSSSPMCLAPSRHRKGGRWLKYAQVIKNSHSQ
jgi:hypothetical protein